MSGASKRQLITAPLGRDSVMFGTSTRQLITAPLGQD